MALENPPHAIWQWTTLIEHTALDLQLNPLWLLSQVWTESSGDPTAERFEAEFQWFFSPERGPLHDSRLTIDANIEKAQIILGLQEFRFQAQSHGLMQVMGSVARELGFGGTHEEFHDPTINIHYGGLYLVKCLKRTAGRIAEALIRYNGSEAYSRLVLSRVSRLADIIRVQTGGEV